MRKGREQEPTQVWPVGHGVDYGQHLESCLQGSELAALGSKIQTRSGLLLWLGLWVP